MRGVSVFAFGLLLILCFLNTDFPYYVSVQSEPKIEITEIGQVDTVGWAGNVHVQDDIAYLSDSEGGLYIIDVSDPENPTELSQFTEGIDELHEIYVDESLVFLADYTDGFKIIDVSDPTDPMQIGRFHDGGEVGAFDILDDLAFIADFVDGLEVVNISDPTNPVEITQI